MRVDEVFSRKYRSDQQGLMEVSFNAVGGMPLLSLITHTALWTMQQVKQANQAKQAKQANQVREVT